MKTYFNFSLTGKKLLPIWLLFLALIVVPYIFMMSRMINVNPADISLLYIFPSLLWLLIVSLIINFYIYKLFIEGVVYNETQVVFCGSFWKYMSIVITGLLLSIVTLGIYAAWFVKRMTKFFVDNSSCNSENFEFKGMGQKLFLIILLTLLVPGIVVGIVFAQYYNISQGIDMVSVTSIIRQIISTLISIPFIYYVYKWMIDIKYKDYGIYWRTTFWPSCGKIFLEIFLTIITVGIYMPLAIIRLYNYYGKVYIFFDFKCADNNYLLAHSIYR